MVSSFNHTHRIRIFFLNLLSSSIHIMSTVLMLPLPIDHGVYMWGETKTYCEGVQGNKTKHVQYDCGSLSDPQSLQNKR